MKRLIISVLMLLGATLIFSQGNKSDSKEVNSQTKVVKTEVQASKVS
ncbi:MAG: hypothetical protein R2802_13340 [Flavobacteriaceae bacterium]|nr:hypothetical protein [Mangrovimonas sp.]MCB0469147.1 hypothetical protein [Flavobacteriaceae bacterium]MCB0432096.1 hypothetical protein [Mangrovimonas sp.]MCB0435916.1 hypothetical protein [Mangrovimonas sp.]MCB0438848.1 hypothetical protein [Mangrovimonas sp.]